MRANTDHFNDAVLVEFTDDRHDFRRAYVQTHDQILVTAFGHFFSAPLAASISRSALSGLVTGVLAPSFHPIVKPLL